MKYILKLNVQYQHTKMTIITVQTIGKILASNLTQKYRGWKRKNVCQQGSKEKQSIQCQERVMAVASNTKERQKVETFKET